MEYNNVNYKNIWLDLSFLLVDLLLCIRTNALAHYCALRYLIYQTLRNLDRSVYNQLLQNYVFILAVCLSNNTFDMNSSYSFLVL